MRRGFSIATDCNASNWRHQPHQQQVLSGCVLFSQAPPHLRRCQCDSQSGPDHSAVLQDLVDHSLHSVHWDSHSCGRVWRRGDSRHSCSPGHMMGCTLTQCPSVLMIMSWVVLIDHQACTVVVFRRTHTWCELCGRHLFQLR